MGSKEKNSHLPFFLNSMYIKNFLNIIHNMMNSPGC